MKTNMSYRRSTLVSIGNARKRRSNFFNDASIYESALAAGKRLFMKFMLLRQLRATYTVQFDARKTNADKRDFNFKSNRFSISCSSFLTFYHFLIQHFCLLFFTVRNVVMSIKKIGFKLCKTL